MNSFNHFALGAVGQWMYEFQLGITTDPGAGAAGYKHFVLQPSCGGSFTALEGSYESHYGRIESAWTADKGVMTSYGCTVPANTTATLYLPVPADTRGENGDGAACKGSTVRNGLDTICYELTSGSFTFRIGNGRVYCE